MENREWRIEDSEALPSSILYPLSPVGVSAIVVILFVLCTFTAFGQDDALPNRGRAFTNSVGMRMVRVEPGAFLMGSRDGDLDEEPPHVVEITRPFYAGAFEVTNAQYEQFDPNHRALRGKLGFSNDDDEAVVFVSWHDAVAFTEWLSEREGLPYRLPTEAEWEYAARAGTTTPYHTGDDLPAAFLKNPRASWYPDKDRPHPDDVVPLTVGRTPPNAWGLYDVHGNVEEWTLDWYGPYTADGASDPVGRAAGDFRVTRGGSHSTEPYYLRSANRMGTLPENEHWLIGFRVVLGAMPETAPLPVPAPPPVQLGVAQRVPAGVADGPPADTPYFAPLRPYIKLNPTERGPFYYHNHQAAISETPNGDLLAIWYTTKEETGRYLAQAASRLRYGADQWEPASIFWDVPDRNDHGAALFWDGDETIYHMTGLSVAATWGNLAMVARTSTDNGATWSPGRLVHPEHGLRNQVIASMIRTADDRLIVTADAVSIGSGGTAIHVSADGGATWTDPGGTIAGIHASVVELTDGRLLAFGRGDNVDGRMPKSVSADGGATWTVTASPFPPIASTQRIVLLRLQEGPLFFASFADNQPFTAADSTVYPGSGLFAAVSYDDGETWPVRKLLTTGEPAHWRTTARSRDFVMSPYTAEPRGYMAVTQARDRTVHLISSVYHYAFNLAWLTTPHEAPGVLPPPAEADWDARYRGVGLPSEALSTVRFRGTGAAEGDLARPEGGALVVEPTPGATAVWVDDHPDGFGRADPVRGASVELRAQVAEAASPRDGVDLTLHLGEDNRRGYHIRITPDAVYAFDAFSLFPIAQDLDNASALHTYRLDVDPDGLMRLYRDDVLLAVRSPAQFRDDAIPGDGPYLQWSTSAPVQVRITHVAYDVR